MQVASEHFYNWLLGLRYICQAQLRLQDLRPDGHNILPCLASAIDSYQRALVSLKVTSFIIYYSIKVCSLVVLRCGLGVEGQGFDPQHGEKSL